MVITGLTGLLAAYLSALVPGLTGTMDRAVSTAVRVMATDIGLDTDLDRVTVITRRLPMDSLAADIPQGVSTAALASVSMAVDSMVAAVPIDKIICYGRYSVTGAGAKCSGSLIFLCVL
jgi:seryl-tRNA(Sec) selenium transferase